MRTFARAGIGTAILVVVVYLADAAWARARPTGSVQVRVLLAVPQKGNRVEFIPGDTEIKSCVHALFPHLGLEPCWYLERHTHKQVNY